MLLGRVYTFVAMRQK